MHVKVEERTGSSERAGGRDRILQVARAAFVDRGYADVSMQEIADAAGLTKPAIYYHFTDKQDLFEAVVIAEMERLHHGVAEQLAPGPPLRSQLERVTAFALGAERGDLSRLIADAQRYCGRDRLRVLKAQIETPFGLLRAAFVAAQERGEIGDSDIDRVLTLFLNMIEGQLKGSGFGVVIDAPSEELARTITDLLMDGIATSRRPTLPGGTPGQPHHP